MDPVTSLPASGDAATPLEWRRRFYDHPDSSALVFASVVAILAAILAFGAIHAAVIQHAHPSLIVMWSGGAVTFAGASLAYVVVSGAIPVRRNRVTYKDGAHSCTGPGLAASLVACLMYPGMLAAGIGMIAADTLGVVAFSQDRRYFVVVVGVITLIGYVLWQLITQQVGNRIRFTPQQFTSRTGADKVTAPWDSIRAMTVHDGPSKRRPFGLGRRTGILVTVIGDANLPGTPNPDGTQSFVVELGRYSADEDTLYNVMVAARDHVKVRQLFGHKEGNVLFTGPPRKTRATLRRTQVWLPWERGIQETLGVDVAGEHSLEPSEP